MVSKTGWILKQHLRKVWVRVVGYAIVAVLIAILAQWLSPWMPETLQEVISMEAVNQVLNILASSMLAVTTFSLSISVSAFAAAAGNATPRATELLQEDRTTQYVLATFLGAFLFSLVGILALKAGFYDGGGRLLLFVATVAVVSLVVIALLRWMTHLMRFGRLSDTLDRVEKVSIKALTARAANPYLGGHPLHTAPPPTATPLYAVKVGYVQHIDLAALSLSAETLKAQFYLAALPGCFVHQRVPLLWIEGASVSDEDAEAVRAAFSCANARTFDQDPRFGLIVLAEIASRALSPAVNDPGTAIEVIGRLVRVLSHWQPAQTPDVVYPRLHLPPVREGEMLEDALRPLARDGAGLIEVQIRLQKALITLAAQPPGGFAQPALYLSTESVQRARTAGLLNPEIKQLEALAASIDPI
ncbi:DUF2254 domain-containing protein [Thiorhodospira sibirica]|uniref:DUF2254 domain-containing protein n=1 Tax=Thiorhodospira sibirica TaxID=154347 RepID=UPI00022C2DD9|nr:DUF2254 domain-containing protein [Thiorhodospira sibirica]